MHSLGAIRRRRVISVLAAGSVLCAVLAMTSRSAVAWTVAAGVGAALVTYGVLLFRLRTRAAQREMQLAFGTTDWWTGEAADPVEKVALPPLLDRWEITRVLWGGVAGCLLDVVTALTDRLIGRPVSGRRAVWLARSERLQGYLRRQSRWAFTASAAAVVMAGPLAHAASAAGAPAAATYTVKAGDTLGAIASPLHTTVAALASANHIANTNLIHAGQ